MWILLKERYIMKNKRTERTSIRMRPDILECAEALKKQYNYSKADIFEMGVLMLENNIEQENIIKNKVYSDLIKRLSNIESSISKECDNIKEVISLEINNLKAIQETPEIEEYDLSSIDDVVQSIVNIAQMREDEKKYGSRGRSFEPLGKEFYELKSKEYGVPLDVILEKLENLGYTESRLLDLGMNPAIMWRGYSVAKESLL